MLCFDFSLYGYGYGFDGGRMVVRSVGEAGLFWFPSVVLSYVFCLGSRAGSWVLRLRNLLWLWGTFPFPPFEKPLSVSLPYPYPAEESPTRPWTPISHASIQCAVRCVAWCMPANVILIPYPGMYVSTRYDIIYTFSISMQKYTCVTNVIYVQATKLQNRSLPYGFSRKYWHLRILQHC